MKEKILSNIPPTTNSEGKLPSPPNSQGWLLSLYDKRMTRNVMDRVKEQSNKYYEHNKNHELYEFLGMNKGA